MSKYWNRASKVKPHTTTTDSEQAYKLSNAPQFKNAKQYTQAKLIMLKNDFYINPTETEITHLYELATENEINCAVRQIINDHWK
jgi:hypothetical protein